MRLGFSLVEDRRGHAHCTFSSLCVIYLISTVPTLQTLNTFWLSMYTFYWHDLPNVIFCVYHPLCPSLQSTAFVSFKLTTKGCRSSSWWVEMIKNGWTRWHRDKLKVEFARDIIIIIKCLADRLERSCLPTARNFQQRVSINVVTHLYAMTNGSLEFVFPVFSLSLILRVCPVVTTCSFLRVCPLFP